MKINIEVVHENKDKVSGSYSDQGLYYLRGQIVLGVNVCFASSANQLL